MQWRLSYKADEITEADVRDELKTGKVFFHKHDKKGNPCIVV